MDQPARAVVKWRHPVQARAVAAVTLQAIASLVHGVQDRGRQETGSTAVPTMQPRPIPAQVAPATGLGAVRWARAATMSAVTGIGHGAATPAPQPASNPAGTDSGTLTPNGRPGS